MTFFDFPEHCLVEKKKKDKCHSSDAKDIQNWKKKKSGTGRKDLYLFSCISSDD